LNFVLTKIIYTRMILCHLVQYVMLNVLLLIGAFGRDSIRFVFIVICFRKMAHTVYVDGMACFGKTRTLMDLMLTYPSINVMLSDYYNYTLVDDSLLDKHCNTGKNLMYAMNNLAYCLKAESANWNFRVIDRHPIASVVYDWVQGKSENVEDVFPEGNHYIIDLFKTHTVVICLCSDFEGIHKAMQNRDGGKRFDCNIPFEFHEREYRMFSYLANKFGWLVFEIDEYKFDRHYLLKSIILKKMGLRASNID
jgi:hypothetical protein